MPLYLQRPCSERGLCQEWDVQVAARHLACHLRHGAGSSRSLKPLQPLAKVARELCPGQVKAQSNLSLHWKEIQQTCCNRCVWCSRLKFVCPLAPVPQVVDKISAAASKWIGNACWYKVRRARACNSVARFLSWSLAMTPSAGLQVSRR